MTDQSTRLDATRIRGLFTELSQRLTERGVSAQLFVVGGAAITLAYDRGRSTRDIDALFVPASEVRKVAEALAARHGLEPDWLNDAVKGFLPGADPNPTTVFESASLLVQIPSARYLLAMKILASRDDRDLEDAATLVNFLGYTTADEALDALTSWYPVAQLLPRHRYLAQIITDLAATQRKRSRSTIEDQMRQAPIRRIDQPEARRAVSPPNVPPHRPRRKLPERGIGR